MDVKVCTHCKQEKELSAYSKAKGRKYGVKSRCKVCVSATRNIENDKLRSKKHYDTNKEQVKIRMAGTSSRLARVKRGDEQREIATRRKLIKILKSKLRNDKKSIRQLDKDNKQPELDAIKCFWEWRTTQASKEWLQEFQRGRDRRYYDNGGKQRQQQRFKEWKLENPVLHKYRMRAGKHKREKRLKGLHDGTVTAAAIVRIQTERLCCPYCGKGLNESNRHIDHMNPVSKGGLHSVSNLIMCCDRCNVSKSDKSFDEWLGQIDEPHRVVALNEYNRKAVSV